MDEGNVGKDLAIKEKIESIVSKIKSGETVEQEELMIAVKGVGIPLTIEKDEKEALHKINILGAHILTLENEELSFTDGWEEDLKSKTEGIIDAEDLINELKEMELSLARQKEEQEKAEEVQKDEKDLSRDREEKNKKDPKEKELNNNKKPEKKEEQQEIMKKESIHWQKMDLDREFTDTENLRKYIKDVLGYHIGSGRLYRARTGTHDFKYMVEKDGKYEELDLTSDFGGRNTREEIYILDEDGNFRKDEVDSLLLTRDGNRGIATKLPDTGSSDVTKSFAVTREKGGKFVATQLIEKSGQNRNPNLPGKDRLDRGRGREEIGDDLDNLEEMENKDLKIADDGITVQEITLYEHLEKKGYRPEAIDRMIKDIQENEISVDEAEINEKQREEGNEEKTPWGDAEGRRSRW